MSGYRPRPYLSAQVPPRAALIIVRDFGPQLERHAAVLAASADLQTRETAEELRLTLASMREAAGQWRARVDETEHPEHAPGSASGSGVVPTEPVESPSRAPSEVSSLVTVGEAATRLGCSPEYVRRLARGGGLSGTRQGGMWLIDEGSVADYQTRRASA